MTDDWLPLYVDFVLANLQAELPALQGKRLACDCGPDGVCEADALAGMVFDATHPAESLGGGTGRPGALWSGRRLSWARSEAVTP